MLVPDMDLYRKHTGISYLASEAALRILLLICFLYTESMKPFERIIQPEEWWLYKYPKVDVQVFDTFKLFSKQAEEIGVKVPSQVHNAAILRLNAQAFVTLVATLSPLFTILIFSGVGRTAQSDVIPAALCSTLGLMLNGLVTNCIKLGVGRPRPDFFFRCFPDGNPPAGQPSTYHLRCTGDIDQIIEGRKSFPSGHSSFSFVSLGFCSLYICGKLQSLNSTGRGKSWRLVISFIPLLFATMIAISRTCDYRHHWQDVLIGSLIGSAVNYVIYHQYYPSLTSQHCHLPLREAFNRGDEILPLSAPPSSTAVKHM